MRAKWKRSLQAGRRFWQNDDDCQLGKLDFKERYLRLWKGPREKIVDGFPSVVIQVASACARKVLVCDLRIRIGGPRLAGPSVPSIAVLIEYE